MRFKDIYSMDELYRGTQTWMSIKREENGLIIIVYALFLISMHLTII